MREYHAHAADRLDLGWLLKSAAAGVGADGRIGESIGPQSVQEAHDLPPMQ